MPKSRVTILPITTESDGVGFINPVALPNFASGMTKLHLIRKSEARSRYNRITQDVGDLRGQGIEYQGDRAFSNNAAHGMRLVNNQLDYVNGFTLAVAVQIPAVDDFVNILISEDWDAAGVRIRANPSSADFGITTQVRTAGGEADNVSGSRQIPSGNPPYWIFISWDGTTLFQRHPAIGGSRESGLSGSTFDTPDANADLLFINSSGSAAVNIGIWSFAQWDRALSTSEMDAENEKLKAWGSALGVNFA